MCAFVSHTLSNPFPFPPTPLVCTSPARLPYPDTAIMLLNRTKKEIKEELGSMQQLLITVWEEVLGRLRARDCCPLQSSPRQLTRYNRTIAASS